MASDAPSVIIPAPSVVIPSSAQESAAPAQTQETGAVGDSMEGIETVERTETAVAIVQEDAPVTAPTGEGEGEGNNTQLSTQLSTQQPEDDAQLEGWELDMYMDKEKLLTYIE